MGTFNKNEKIIYKEIANFLNELIEYNVLSSKELYDDDGHKKYYETVEKITGEVKKVLAILESEL